MLRVELEAAGKEVPGFCLVYRCSVLKEGLTPVDVKETAGRYQSRSQAVHPMTFSDTFELLLMEARERQDEDGTYPKRKDLLQSIYLMSGKTPLIDGDRVCCLVSAPGPECLLAMLQCFVIYFAHVGQTGWIAPCFEHCTSW